MPRHCKRSELKANSPTASRLEVKIKTQSSWAGKTTEEISRNLFVRIGCISFPGIFPLRGRTKSKNWLVMHGKFDFKIKCWSKCIWRSFLQIHRCTYLFISMFFCHRVTNLFSVDFIISLILVPRCLPCGPTFFHYHMIRVQCDHLSKEKELMQSIRYQIELSVRWKRCFVSVVFTKGKLSNMCRKTQIRVLQHMNKLNDTLKVCAFSQGFI